MEHKKAKRNLTEKTVLHSGTTSPSQHPSSPSWQQLCNLGPLIAPLLVCLVDDVVLLVRPGTLLDGRVQVVMPSLPALLPDAALQVLRDQGPSLGTVLLHQLDDLLILLQGKEV